MTSKKDLDIVTIGHALVDIRFIVEFFANPDQESPILKQTRGVGGSAANVAIDVAKLGGKSGIIVKLGLDDFGRMVVDELMRHEVDVSGVRVCIADTGFTIVIIDKTGRVIMYGFKGAAEKLEPSDLDRGLISRAKYVHIASLRPDTSLAATNIAHETGATVSWDPGRVLARKGAENLKNLLERVDIILANKYEAKSLTGLEDYKEAAEKILEYGPEIVIVKRGREGVYTKTRRGEEYELPAFAVEKVVDTTGAGDAFAAGLLLGLSRGYSLKKALIYANAVAALKVSRLGSHSVPSHDEVIEFIWDKGLW